MFLEGRRHVSVDLRASPRDCERGAIKVATQSLYGWPEDCQYHYPAVKGSVNAPLARKSNPLQDTEDGLFEEISFIPFLVFSSKVWVAVVRSFDVDGGGKGLESKSRFPLCLERAFDVFLSFGPAFSLDRIFVHFYFWDLFRLVSIFYETHFR